jgi:hypothetical protein
LGKVTREDVYPLFKDPPCSGAGRTSFGIPWKGGGYHGVRIIVKKIILAVGEGGGILGGRTSISWKKARDI